MTRVRFVGGGRAGTALATALSEVGYTAVGVLGREDRQAEAAAGVDLLIIATPDSAVPDVAAAIETNPDCVVMHLAGALGLDVLKPHPRRASVHPLMAIPSGPIGARRLLDGGWFAVSGDEAANEMVAALGGRAFVVNDAQRVLYHATAAVAANHVVAVMGQVERLAARAGVPFEAMLRMAQGNLAAVGEIGAAAALTGPAARGDHSTIDAHRAALPTDELATYDALAREAERLAAQAKE